MSEMYVANVSKQNIQFAYRVPERKGVVIQPIRAGFQVKLSPHGTMTNLSAPDIDSIVGQYSKYGMVNVSDIDLSRGTFAGLCYSLDKPVPVAKLERALVKNEESLEKLGLEMRTEAAVAVNQAIEEGAGTEMRGLEMSVTEIEPPGGYRTEKPVAQGVRVTRSDMEPDHSGPLPAVNVSSGRQRGRKGR
jgi:hypothetical protein